MLSFLLALAFQAADRSAPRSPDADGQRARPSAEELARLPRDGGERYNRLVFEASPYLFEHATNPVDWYPWGEEAFTRAALEKKPIFLSIGYSTCHWCHVMEEESFEDPGVAALLNEHFVSVKVDREERPDVDAVYMDVVQAVTGSGGWPMTLVLTPDKKPFFAATYLPKESRFGRPGLMDVLGKLYALWTRDRARLQSDGENTARYLRAAAERTSATALPGRELIERANAELAQAFDAEHGGFGSAPKFPLPHHVLFLLQHWRRSGDERALAMAEASLRAMRRGGIYDQLGFGLHRYSTDPTWTVPHFEKMLYDQALFMLAATAAFQISGERDFQQMTEATALYVERDLWLPGSGLVAAAEDADSEGEEGTFYLWTVDQVRAALADRGQAEIALASFGITPQGNFEEPGGARGRNVLRFLRPLAEAQHRAEGELPGPASGFDGRLQKARADLELARRARVRPLRDDKALADWNGLYLAARSRAEDLLPGDGSTARLTQYARSLLAAFRDEHGRLAKYAREGRAFGTGQLDDYAFLVFGLIELHQATQDPAWLAEALALNATLVEHFLDRERGGFYATPDDGEALLVRPKSGYDGALPSGNSIQAWNLLRLSLVTGDRALRELAEGTLRAFASELAASPSARTQMLLALDVALGPSFEVVIVGDPADPASSAMLRAVRGLALPHAVLIFRPTSGETSVLDRVAPWTKDLTAEDGKPTAYLCRDQTCERPTTDLAELIAALTRR